MDAILMSFFDRHCYVKPSVYLRIWAENSSSQYCPSWSQHWSYFGIIIV